MLDPCYVDGDEFAAWDTAWTHIGTVQWIMSGAYPPQLTAHAAPRPIPAAPVTPRCTCRYGLRKVSGAPAPWIPVKRPGIRQRVLMTWCFRIDPRCPHHGRTP